MYIAITRIQIILSQSVAPAINSSPPNTSSKYSNKGESGNQSHIERVNHKAKTKTKTSGGYVGGF